MLSRLESLLNTLVDAKYILVICHHNADPDALGSAVAFSCLLAHSLPLAKVEACAPQGLSRVSRQIMPLFPALRTSVEAVDTVDAVVLVDTNTLSQLDELGARLRNLGKPLLFIDHHSSHPETRLLATHYIADEEASSASEVVYELFEEAGVQPDRDAALAMFLGIAYDTHHFSLAKSRTLRAVARLVKAGVVAEEALPFLNIPMSNPERVARLKSAQRLRCFTIGRWHIVESKVGSFQASAARALVMLGAHVAVVGGERKGKLRISLRSSTEFYKDSRVHLGRDVAYPLGKSIKGTGGGHSTSAGFNGDGDIEMALRECLNLLNKAIREPNEVSRPFSENLKVGV